MGNGVGVEAINPRYGGVLGWIWRLEVMLHDADERSTLLSEMAMKLYEGLVNAK